jgi:N6-adenosine-specific RNA methylase IME4
MKRYNIIYADPPWAYNYSIKSTKCGTAASHYQTMQNADICALPVSQLASDDAILFLWATLPKLIEALEVVKAWGFNYKTTAFVWIKQNRIADSLYMGLGFWTRSNAEICLLATRGHIKRQSKQVLQVIVSHIEQHSKKPDEARSRIVELVGDLPRIELFARERTAGWDVWGNEVDSSIDLVSYNTQGGERLGIG